METYTWFEYIANDTNQIIDRNIKDSIKQLVSLSNHSCLITEVILFRKNYHRILVRLRNCKLTSLLKKVRKLLSLFINIDIGSQLFSNCQQFFNDQVFENKKITVNLPTQTTILKLMQGLEKCGHILMNVCQYTSCVVIHCLLWLKLGHLLPYFIFILSTISRLNIISRALLVHVCDVYLGFYKFLKSSIKCDPGDIPSSINHFLTKLNLIPLTISESINQQNHNDVFQKLLIEDVGTPLNRNLDSNNKTQNENDAQVRYESTNVNLSQSLEIESKRCRRDSFTTKSNLLNVSFHLLTTLKKQKKQKYLIKKYLKRMKKNEMFLKIDDS